MTVSAVMPLPNHKGKVKVCLRGGADFVLYKREWARWDLKEGEELTEEDYDKILGEILIPRAKKRAMHLLEKMDRSAGQLAGKLADNGYPPEAIEEALAYVTSFHYLDDERLARNHIRFYQNSRSKNRIVCDLRKKGIDRDLIARCMEEEYESSEISMMERLLEKKNFESSTATAEERAKMYRFLLQRGFCSSDIAKVLRWDGNT